MFSVLSQPGDSEVSSDLLDLPRLLYLYNVDPLLDIKAKRALNITW